MTGRRGWRWRKHIGSLGQYEDVEAVLKQLPATDPGARAILARIAYRPRRCRDRRVAAGEGPR